MVESFKNQRADKDFEKYGSISLKQYEEIRDTKVIAPNNDWLYFGEFIITTKGNFKARTIGTPGDSKSGGFKVNFYLNKARVRLTITEQLATRAIVRCGGSWAVFLEFKLQF